MNVLVKIQMLVELATPAIRSPLPTSYHPQPPSPFTRGEHLKNSGHGLTAFFFFFFCIDTHRQTDAHTNI